MDAMTAQARRFYHHVHHGGTLKESDVAAMVRWMEGKDATIARLTAELDEARASAAAAYERAADISARRARSYEKQKRCPGRNVYLLDQKMDTSDNIAQEIRALDPDASAALAARDKRVREAERARFDGYILHKRACALAGERG